MKTIEELEKQINKLKKSYRSYAFLVTMANVSDGDRIFKDETLSDTEKVKKLGEVQMKIVELSRKATMEVARLTH